ncbi:MAG: DUF1553 domain-containing protein [Acidobacteria bacterium]|nr:DUF1553 domain-containing protein [Acidobacteriota bacterium]
MEFNQVRYLALSLLAVVPLSAAPEPIQGDRFFEEKVRPVLAESCFACHTQNKLGGLRLDSRAAMLEGGKSGPAIVPGSPDESLLIKAIHQSGDLKMPMGNKLPDDQIAALTEWVKMGAPWPEAPQAMAPKTDDGFHITAEQRNFWSFRPFSESAPPQLKDKRAHNYVDNYVFARLEKEGLAPNQAADRTTLIRRASLDLTGLPPTPEEVQEFVNDKSPDAYSKLIDRLLASKQYGERWGRHWLDVVRYGENDTRGLARNRKGHEDYPMAHIYRDWVIKAFNDDMPYDKFVKYQLAADLMGKSEWKDKPTGEFDVDQQWGRLQVTKWDGLEKEERRKIIPYGHIVDESLDQDNLPALGLLGIGPWYYDLGDARQMRADERNDRVDVVTRGFLGLTVGCARCHNHKYDPVSANDYYALAGVFYNSPYHEYPLADQAIVDHWRYRDELVKQQKKRMSDFLEKQAESLAMMHAYQTKDYMVAAWKVSGEPKKQVAEAAYEGKLDVEVLERWIKFLDKNPVNYPYLIEWQSMIRHGGSLEAAECIAENFQETLLAIAHEYDENDERNEKIEIKAWPLDDKPPIPMPNEFNTSFEKYDIEKESMKRERVNLYTDAFRFNLDDGQNEGNVSRRQPGLFRFSDWGLESRLTAPAKEYLEKLKTDLKALEKQRGDQYPFAMGVRESDVITELPFHKRGSPMNLGDPVQRRFIEVLTPEGESGLFTKGSGRYELAERIAAHPLTARVIVNRVWKWHFGTGLVNTPSNFGIVGEKPSHPELLEYLAQRFVDGGMSIKQLHKDVMLSYVYQQSSEKNAEAAEKDPENRLLWRFNRQRMDAEQVRDSLLFVSGLLDDEMFGKSGDIDSPKFKRRAVYAEVSRFLLADYFKTFDFPNPNLSASERFSTSVPTQRLFFMNSEFMFNTAKAFAKRISKPEPSKEEKAAAATKGKGGKGKGKPPAAAEGDKKTPDLSPEQRIERAYLILYGRKPNAEEIAAGLEFVKAPENQLPEDDTSEDPLTAWDQYARVLLSSNEFTFMN